MRKLNKFFALLIAVMGISMTAKAQEDYTSYIKNASVAENKDWEGGLNYGNGGLYKTSAGSFDFTQTITLPAGQYKMTVKAAYRYAGSSDTPTPEEYEYNQIQVVANTHLAKLYAQTTSYKYEANVQNRWEGASDTDYLPGGSSTVNGKFVPNSSDAVKAWFDNGKYVNELVFNVQEEGQVKIGIAKSQKPAGGDYTNIGAWTLTRLGDAEADPKEEPTPAGTLAGTYYLYNVGANKFLCSGNNWGSHASVAEGGIPVTLAGSENVYTISTAAIYADKFLSGDGWMDGGSFGWTFEQVSDGTYKLKSGNNVLFWNGGESTNTTVGADPGTDASLWQLVTEEARVAALAAATKDNPIDATFLIKNAYFAKGNGHYFVRNGSYNSLATSTSWKGTDLTDFWGIDEGSENACYAVEQYGKTFDNYQELTVPNGRYFMTAKGFYRGSVVPYIYANSEKCNLKVKGDIGGDNLGNGAIALRGNDYLLDGVNVVVTDGSLRVGVKSDATIEWCMFDDFKLIYNGPVDLSEYVALYQGALTKAQDVAAKTDKMELAVKNALATAISTYSSVDQTNQSAMEVAIAALETATTNAENSISAYASTAKYFTKMESVLANTNVYTKEAYDSYYGTWLAAYEANTLETSIAATLNESAAYSTGWHATNYIDDILLSAWTIGGKQAKDYDLGLYINTWSTEGETDGSEFRAPFFEYWVSDGDILGATTIQAKIKGLEAEALYSFTIRARVRQTNEKEKIANGITMLVGDGESVDISSGTQFNGGAFYIGNFTAQGGTDAEGTLTVTITVAENSNISWFSFYNAKYTKGEDLSGDIANYEFALANATAALSKSMDPNLRPELEAVVEANKNVSKTNKKALEAAKQALEAAVEKVAKSIAALEGSDLSEWTTTKNNGKFEVNTWSTEGKTDGSNMLTPFAQNWIEKGNSLTEVTMGYKLTEQQVGFYKVSGLVRSLNEKGDATPEGSFIFANEAISRAYVGDSCKNGVYANPIVYAYVGEDGELNLGFKTIRANVNWIAWKNLTVEYIGTELTAEIVANLKAEAPEIKYVPAEKEKLDAALKLLDTPTAANYVAAATAIEAAYKVIDVDYTELQAAYEKAAADTADKKLGFEKGDYAPYINAALLQALQDAKKMLTDKAETSQQRIIAITETLGTSKWIANTEDVDAVYNGDFAIVTEGANYPNGWTRTNAWGQMQTNVEGCNNGTAYYNQPGSLVYGQTGVYTMPLAANTYYDFSFKYRSHEEDSNKEMTVYILNQAKEGLDTLKYAGNASKTEWVEKKVTFKTGAAGNYALTLVNSGNTWLTDVSLVKTPATEVVVTIEYDYATMMLPFDAECPEGMQVYTCTEVDGNTIKLEAVESIKANTPYIVDGTPGKYSFSGISIAKEATYTSGLLTGTYAEVAAPVDSYVLQNGAQGFAFYRVAEGKQPKVGAYHCYLTVPAEVAGAPMFSITRGEDTTGIENATLNAQPSTVIYDLMGRKVTTMVKGGMYIVNGKKVIVK